MVLQGIHTEDQFIAVFWVFSWGFAINSVLCTSWKVKKVYTIIYMYVHCLNNLVYTAQYTTSEVTDIVLHCDCGLFPIRYFSSYL